MDQPTSIRTDDARCVDKRYVSEYEMDLASGLVGTLLRWFATRER